MSARAMAVAVAVQGPGETEEISGAEGGDVRAPVDAGRVRAQAEVAGGGGEEQQQEDENSEQ